MPIISAKEFVQTAYYGAYAVGGFNTINLEWTQAILRAAQKKQAPVLLQTSMAPAQYMGGYHVCRLFIESLVKDMGITIPVALHLDHGNYEAVKACIEIGYSSVMFDGSMLPLEENLAQSAELIKLAHAKGISIECEVGSIGGSEDGIYGEGLDFEHLKKLREALPELPLVLHGGSSIPDEQIKKAIGLGVAKINVNTECHLAFTQATLDNARHFDQNKAEFFAKKYYDLRTFLKPGFDAIEKTVTDRIEAFGSSGKGKTK